MSIYLKNLIYVLGLSLVTGVVTRPVEEPAWRWVQEREPALQLENMQDALGQGVMVGVLGGFRSVAANLLWIRGMTYWQERDLPSTQTLIRLVTAIDPRPSFFWINGARITAYDMPHWRIRELGGKRHVPDVVQEDIFREQNEMGMELLHRAMSYHPQEPQYPLEIALILSRRMDRVEEGAEYYRKAAEMPGAPAYAARIHAELLRRLGRLDEAYAWFVEHLEARYPNLSELNRRQALERVRDMERELGIPLEDQFQPENRTD